MTSGRFTTDDNLCGVELIFGRILIDPVQGRSRVANNADKISLIQVSVICGNNTPIFVYVWHKVQRTRNLISAGPSSSVQEQQCWFPAIGVFNPGRLA